MNDITYPRSPREMMAGWIYLPRYIDKIRLHLAGNLHPDYQPNFGKGFDGMWLLAADVTHEQMIEVVQNSLTDGDVCDWVRENIKASPATKAAHRETMLSRPAPDDVPGQQRLQQRKVEAGITGRDDVKTFVDLIDADEKRI
ncbi:MAG: DUF5069 domain-containing protein [Verrucomicrobiota bacterium]